MKEQRTAWMHRRCELKDNQYHRQKEKQVDVMAKEVWISGKLSYVYHAYMKIYRGRKVSIPELVAFM